MKFLVVPPVALVPCHSAEICSAFGSAAALKEAKGIDVENGRTRKAGRDKRATNIVAEAEVRPEAKYYHTDTRQDHVFDRILNSKYAGS
jgi:hypothetical protein